jgi:hypothetical protein
MPDNDQYHYLLGQPFFSHHKLLSMVDTYFERLLVRPDLGFTDHDEATMGMGRILALPIDFDNKLKSKAHQVNMVRHQRTAEESAAHASLESVTTVPWGARAAHDLAQAPVAVYVPPHRANITQYTLRDPAAWFAESWDGHDVPFKLRDLPPHTARNPYTFDWSDGNRDKCWRHLCRHVLADINHLDLDIGTIMYRCFRGGTDDQPFWSEHPVPAPPFHLQLVLTGRHPDTAALCFQWPNPNAAVQYC